MPIDFVEIGQRLRAYRMGAGLSPEDVAERLQISRAALYKYEKGEVIKLDTIERLAELLGISIPALLGVGVEYFSNPVTYYERKRQLEENSEQLIVYFEPLSFVLMSPEYVRNLRTMLVEGLPRNFAGRAAALQQIERVMAIMEERRDQVERRRKNIVSLVSAIHVQRFLRAGMIGTFDLPPDVQEERRRAARIEVERTAALMANEPIGVQIAVIADTMSNQTFQIFQQREKTWVAVSPFRLGEFPNIRMGVASLTSAPDAVAHYSKLAEDLWAMGAKGQQGADFLRRLVAEVAPDSRPHLVGVPKKPRR